MKKQIARISVHQTSKVLAILYVVMSLVFVPVGLVMIINAPQHSMIGWMYLLMPVFYGLFGYLFAAFFCWIYNITAKNVGGVEFTVVECGEEA